MFGVWLNIYCVVVFIQVGMILVGMTEMPSIEMIEPDSKRPAIKWTHRCNFIDWCQMIFSQCIGVVAVFMKNLCDTCLISRQPAVITRKACCCYRKQAHMHGMSITTCEQCG